MSDTEPRFLGWPGPPAHRHCGEASFGFGDFDFCSATVSGGYVTLMASRWPSGAMNTRDLQAYLAGPSEPPAHSQVHGALTGSVQGLLAMTMCACTFWTTDCAA